MDRFEYWFSLPVAEGIGFNRLSRVLKCEPTRQVYTFKTPLLLSLSDKGKTISLLQLLLNIEIHVKLYEN